MSLRGQGERAEETQPLPRASVRKVPRTRRAWCNWTVPSPRLSQRPEHVAAGKAFLLSARNRPEEQLPNYKEFADVYGGIAQAAGPVLNSIALECTERREPDLSCLVVRADTGLPGVFLGEILKRDDHVAIARWRETLEQIRSHQWRDHRLAPASLLPAEVQDTALDLLRRLVGEPLRTVDGAVNTVLALTATDALVGTARSPRGRPVRVAAVEQALERLRKDGSVTLDVLEVGYRSAFIGAVLLTLPGVQVSGSPPRISLGATATNSETRTYEGDLSRPRTADDRREQTTLRRLLIGEATSAECALCGITYPVRLLWAAHIKKRAACSEDERRDLPNVAMLACLFGCDALFEMGYIGVDASGHIVTSPDGGDVLEPHLAAIRSRPVRKHTPATSGYFAWHLTTTFRAM